MARKAAAEDGARTASVEDEVVTEGAVAAAEEAREESFVGKLSHHLFAPELRWGNAKLLMNAALFGVTIYLAQNYGHLLAQ